jgi:hypothetical protein
LDYRSPLDVYRRVSDSPLGDELARLVSELEELMSRNKGSGYISGFSNSLRI